MLCHMYAVWMEHAVRSLDVSLFLLLAGGIVVEAKGDEMTR